MWTEHTIEELIQNPSTHYGKGDGTNYVPIASTSDLTNDWWNPETKTLYDPCPNGYRIPKLGTYGTGSEVATHPDWSDWSEGGLKSGRTFKNTSFFPASGIRGYNNGTYVRVPTEGSYWAATSHSTINGYFMKFTSSFVDPNRTASRSWGLSLRCIAEQSVIPSVN